MADIVDQKTRSRVMAAIGGKNTKPELTLRKALHAKGFRYRLHARDVSGKPDLLLKKYNVVVFVHGCFWHRHSSCRYSSLPSTNSVFWENKLNSNVRRDKKILKELLESGWRVAKIWECALRTQAEAEITIEILSDWLHGSNIEIEIPASTTFPIERQTS